MPAHDDDSAMRGAAPLPDPHGHAALLLVESLIHGLCENGTLDAGEAIEIAERAVNVQHDEAEVADGAAAPMWRSHALLSSIAASLRVDGDRGGDGGDDDTPFPRLVP